MDELLTTRQVQAILKVDRTTIYRMLKSGRLTGVKVGQQWRFREEDVKRALGRASRPQAPEKANGHSQRETLPYPIATDQLQSMQDVFASFAGIGAVTTRIDGTPCTQISNCCRLCQLLRQSDAGQSACIASWRELAHLNGKQTSFFHCHAGMSYARSFIELGGYPVRMLIMGQFLVDPLTEPEKRARAAALAERFGLDPLELVEAMDNHCVLGTRRATALQQLLESMTEALEQIGEERADLLQRLHQIATVSRVPDDR